MMFRHTALSDRAQQNWHEGPLGDHVDAFAAWLQEQGYAPFTVHYFVRLVADLSRWLARHGYGLNELRLESVDAFVRIREQNGFLRPGDAVMLQRLLDFLHESGVIQLPLAVVEETPVDRLCADFAAYLREECGLAAATLKHYLHPVRQLLSQHFSVGPLCLEALDAGTINRFILEQTRRVTPAQAKLVVTALRHFLRHAAAAP